MINFLNSVFENLQKFQFKEAFCISGSTYTYKDLSKHIAGIQRLLNQKKNVNTFGIIVDDNINTYAAIFAIWFNGSSFVPLNCKNPLKRNIQIINEADLEVILISRESHNNILVEDVDKINLNDAELNHNVFLSEFVEEQLAYILYTSGSTGTPKGVQIQFSNLQAFIDSMLALDFKYSTEDKFLQMFDLTFDVSIACMVIPLLNGASLYTLPYGKIKFTYVFKLLKEENINVATIVPSLISFLKPYINDIVFPNVNICILTAEASYFDDINLLKKVIPNSEIYNFYGPTEGTIWTHYYKMEDDFKNSHYNGLLSIGKPLKNVHSIIINSDKEILSDGMKGELCLSGKQITSGYFNNKLMNESSFFNLNIDDKVIRFYKTGDICFKNINNNYMYCGRKDSQIQIQGYRVELGEIENVLRENFKMKNILAIAAKNNSNLDVIYLFIEGLLENNSDRQIEYFLEQNLPAYMVPKKIFYLEKFPVNSSSKVDKTKLKELIKNT